MFCIISREKLEEIFTINSEKLSLMAINDEIGSNLFDYVGAISIKYTVSQKTEIFVGITKVLNSVSEVHNPFALETNITSIQNLNTYLIRNSYYFSSDCYFKKTKNNPLIYYCFFISSSGSIPDRLDNEKIIDNIHEKFIFRIQPYHLTDKVKAPEWGSTIYLSEPDELNFVMQNSMIIQFFISMTENANNLALIYSGSNSNTNISTLNCVDLNNTKKCKISISHFTNQNYKESGLAYLYHSSGNNALKINYMVSPIKVTLPKKIIFINIKAEQNIEKKVLCGNARINIKTDYIDSNNIFDSSDIEKKTSFNSTITVNPYNSPRIYHISCRLWKPKNRNLEIICQVNNTNIKEEVSFQGYFNESIANYDDYRLIISPDVHISFQLKNNTCPFLYSDENIINIKDNDELYELNFKIESYNNEPLFLSNIILNYISLQCSNKGKNMNCKIEKNKLIEQNNNKIFKVYYFDKNSGFEELSLIFDIKVNSNIKKKTIYVNIIKLMQKHIDLNNYVAFQTNVSKISNVISDYFSIDSKNVDNCYFKKTELDNLLLLCRWNSEGDYSLGEIKNKIILNNIHIKYNFIIVPTKNVEIFNIVGTGSLPLFVHPQFLDFYLYDSYTINIMMNYPDNTNNIMMNSYFLSCITYSSTSPPYKTCTVLLDYFKGLYDMHYFYVQHGTNNSPNSPTDFHELSAIGIKLSKSNEIILRIKNENNKNSIYTEKNGIIYFSTIYVDFDNILNSNDIENITKFDSKVVDENKNEYNAKCRLWKPKNYNISIICKLNENLKYKNQNIKLKDTILIYKNYTIYIFSYTYVKVIQVEYSYSFLYSDEQKIIVDDNSHNKYYNLSFNLESYYNDVLYIFGTNDNYALLDDCKADYSNKKLNCKIITEKLNEITTSSGEYFSIGTINDNFGAYKFNNILPIQIIYNNPSKMNIYVELTNYFGKYIEIGVPFGFISNVSDIPNLITQKFNNYCYFKKVAGMNLLYLCSLNYQSYSYKVNISQDMILNNIHWKYNFIIKKLTNIFIFQVFNYGSDVKLIYPNILDFTKNDTLVVRYITQNPSNAERIKINSEASYLGCKNLEGMKLCYVSLAHFRRKSNGIYFCSHSFHYRDSSIYYGTSSINVILPKINAIEFSIEDSQNNFTQYLGKDNILYFLINYNNTSNILDNSETSKFSFNAKFSNDIIGKVVDGSCYFWFPKQENIRIICKLDYKLEEGEILYYNMYINENYFHYKNYTFIYYSNSQNLDIIQTNSEISFLYSDENQEINMDDGTDSYELIFKKEAYYKNQLMLYNEENKIKNFGFICNDKGKEISCIIKKEELIQILTKSGEKLRLYQMTNSLGIIPMNSTYNITINYNKPQKIEINLEIIRILNAIVDRESFIAYETNVTEIPKITTDYFNMKTALNNILKCLLKKNSNKKTDKLFLLCVSNNVEGEDSLALIDEMMIDNINIKYNFKITSKNYEQFTITNCYGTTLDSVYPEEIDFNKQDSFLLRYESKSPGLFIGVKLNYNSTSDLNCNTKNNTMECIVNQSHFSKSGDYYTYHENYYGNYRLKSISYEIPTIKVILKNSSDSEKESNSISKSALIGIIVGSVVGVLLIIGLIIFFVYRHKRKSNKNEDIDDKIGLLSNNIELTEKVDK